MSSNFGLIYVATGNQFRSEAISNLYLSRPFISGIKTCLITDSIVGSECDQFDIVKLHPSPVFSYRDKITGLQDLPFEYNMFLDSDAFVSSPLDSIFKLLSVYDFAAAHAPVRIPPGWSDPSVPQFFPEFNSGVMLIKRSKVSSTLIDKWLYLYDYLLDRYNQTWDQASLRSVLWSMSCRIGLTIFTLSPEFNLRTTKPWIAGRGLPVSVIHGRFPHSEVDPFLSFLNSDIDRFRTWVEWLSYYPDSFIRPRFDRTYS